MGNFPFCSSWIVKSDISTLQIELYTFKAASVKQQTKLSSWNLRVPFQTWAESVGLLTRRGNHIRRYFDFKCEPRHIITNQLSTSWEGFLKYKMSANSLPCHDNWSDAVLDHTLGDRSSFASFWWTLRRNRLTLIPAHWNVRRSRSRWVPPSQPEPSRLHQRCIHFLSGGFMAAGLWLVKNNYIPWSLGGPPLNLNW